MDITKTLLDLENLKAYINNMQKIENPNTFVLGLRIGIVLSEITNIQNELKNMIQINIKSDK